MKTFKLLGLLAALFIIVTTAACGGDDDNPDFIFQNAFRVSGITHPLNGVAFGGDDPFESDEPDSLYSIILVDDGYSLNADTTLIGTGSGMLFFFKSNSTNGLPDGRYNVVEDLDTAAPIVVVSYVVNGLAEDLIFGDDILEDGSVTVGTDGAMRTLIFDGTDANGNTLTGSYSGELRIN